MHRTPSNLEEARKKEEALTRESLAAANEQQTQDINNHTTATGKKVIKRIDGMEESMPAKIASLVLAELAKGHQGSASAAAPFSLGQESFVTPAKEAVRRSKRKRVPTSARRDQDAFDNHVNREKKARKEREEREAAKGWRR